MANWSGIHHLFRRLTKKRRRHPHLPSLSDRVADKSPTGGKIGLSFKIACAGSRFYGKSDTGSKGVAKTSGRERLSRESGGVPE
jgi:hypothetical protein